MGKIKLSSLSKDAKLIVEGADGLVIAAEIYENFEFYKDKDVFTAVPYKANLNAEDILYLGIEQECSNMYADWGSRISSDIKEEDIVELQVVLNRLLERNPEQNMSYDLGELVDIIG